MQAVTIRVAQNGYIVREGVLSADTNQVVELQGSNYHVFPTIQDMTFFVSARLDVPAGEPQT